MQQLALLPDVIEDKIDQITKSEFFHQKLHDYGLLEIAYAIEAVQGEHLEWNLQALNISEVAWNKIIHRGIKPVRAFAHPHILKGDIAEDLVKGFIRRRIRERHLISTESSADHQALLKDGRVLAYASEPDIALYDENHRIQVAIEIKGGIDKAGVLERIGAAIKSLSRAKQENPAAITILVMYKVSMTYQTLEELEAHREEIDYWLAIEDVLNRDSARQEIFRLLEI